MWSLTLGTDKYAYCLHSTCIELYCAASYTVCTDKACGVFPLIYVQIRSSATVNEVCVVGFITSPAFSAACLASHAAHTRLAHAVPRTRLSGLTCGFPCLCVWVSLLCFLEACKTYRFGYFEKSLVKDFTSK